MTEAELEKEFPWITWREPILVKNFHGTAQGFACRYCIAMIGLKGRELAHLPQTTEAFAQHLEIAHARTRFIQ